MWAWKVAAIAVLAGGLGAVVGCGHQSSVPAETSTLTPAADDEQLPFDREGQKAGISPTSTVIPPDANVPAGTPVTVRLDSTISSLRDRAGETFEAVLAEPIMVNGQIIAERGATVTGRIVDAAPAARSATPGYLRLALTSIPLRGHPCLVQTSSNFTKGGPRESAGRGTLMGAASGTGPEAVLGTSAKTDRRAVLGLTARDVSIGPERRLTFRLTEPVPLQAQP